MSKLEVFELYGVSYDFEKMYILDANKNAWEMCLDSHGVLHFKLRGTNLISPISSSEVQDAYKEYQEYLVEKYLLDNEGDDEHSSDLCKATR